MLPVHECETRNPDSKPQHLDASFYNISSGNCRHDLLSNWVTTSKMQFNNAGRLQKSCKKTVFGGETV
jgi:hypothetical protein